MPYFLKLRYKNIPGTEFKHISDSSPTSSLWAWHPDKTRFCAVIWCLAGTLSFSQLCILCSCSTLRVVSLFSGDSFWMKNFFEKHYSFFSFLYFRYIAAPITFLGIAALVVSGGHYTMDVLIAYWLTSHVFWSYHQIFEMRKDDRPQAPLSRLWLVKSFWLWGNELKTVDN